MNKTKLLERVAKNEELTVKEVREYQKIVKPEKQVYGKYGSLARIHIEENKPEMLMVLAGQLPEYLHGIDRQAADLYDTMYAKLSKSERFKKTGDFIKDLQIETEIKGIMNRLGREIEIEKRIFKNGLKIFYLPILDLHCVTCGFIRAF